MKSNFKTIVFLFIFNLLYWLGFTYITLEDNQDWNWTKSILVSIGYALMMSYMFSQLMKNKQLYLAAGQGEGLSQYLKSLGYIEKKRKEDTIFFKKPGFSITPFRYTTIKSSSFYTLMVASEKVIEDIPRNLERIRQPSKSN